MSQPCETPSCDASSFYTPTFTLAKQTYYAHSGIEQNDEQNKAGLKQLAPMLLYANDYKGYDGGSDEDKNHYILELIEEALRQGFLFLFAQTVGAVLLLQFGYLRGRETTLAVS